MLECKLCKEKFETQILFSSHLRHKHNMKYQEYYDAFLKTDLDGKCKVCGKDTKFDHGKYRDYCCVSCMRRSSIVQEKTRATSIQRHCGVGLGSPKIKEKAMQTNLDRYGVKNPYMTEEARTKAHSEEALKKYRETMMHRYGVTNPLQIAENKHKIVKATHTDEVNKKRMQSIKKSNLEKFDVEHNFQRLDVIQSIRDSKLSRQQDFCKINECTPLTELIAKYGTGWCQSNLALECVFDGNTKYIKNHELDKIENYANTNIMSHDEEYICNYIKSIYSGNVIQRSRKIIAPYELDIYIPEKKVAIEYNGVYWHSTNAGVDKNYHLMKTKLCEEKGIRLIHIFQNEWNERNDICKSIIASALGIYENRIYARKCEIKELSTIDTKEFLTLNHIQGYVPSKYNLGLYYNNELVQIITIGKSRYKKDEHELLRMCTKLHTQVIGGFSKLMKNQHYKIVHSYIDRSKFSGNGYYSSNFTFETFTKPSYFYWSPYTVKLNRLACQKHKLPKLLGDRFDPNKTEQQNMINANFYQLYDCGNIKVVYSI